MSGEVIPHDAKPNAAVGAPARKAIAGKLVLVSLPLILFAGLAALFVVGLYSGDPSRLPSQLVGKPPPALALPPVDELLKDGKPVPGLTQAVLGAGRVTVVNVWASWCAPCHVEHPQLLALAKEKGVAILGINYKDKPEDARRFLGRYGNPFEAVGADREGLTAIDWGVYGVPETFVIDRRGLVLHRHVGPITPDVLERELLPVIRRARDG